MRNSVSIAACALVLISVVASDSFAGQPAVAQPANCNELPLALAALQPSPDEILTDAQAAEVRGQWLLNVNLPLVAAVVQGRGDFELTLMTLSGGAYAGNPVIVRIRIGR